MKCNGCGSNFGHDEGCPNALDNLKVQAGVSGGKKYITTEKGKYLIRGPWSIEELQQQYGGRRARREL